MRVVSQRLPGLPFSIGPYFNASLAMMKHRATCSMRSNGLVGPCVQILIAETVTQCSIS